MSNSSRELILKRSLLAFFGHFRILGSKKNVFQVNIGSIIHLVCPPFSVHSGLSSHWRNYCFAEYFFIFLLTLYIVEKPSIGRTDFVTKMRITMNSKADNIARRIRLERSAMYYVSGVINPFILSLASFSTLTWKVRSPIQMWWRGIIEWQRLFW